MILLDTDILSLLLAKHERVSARFQQASDTIATTIITRIEVLDGRFEFVQKAEDGVKLLRAQAMLQKTEHDLNRFPHVSIDEKVAAEFDRLRLDKKLKKIGRCDLLIACIALANHATLATRNLKHFRLVPGLKVENWAD